MKSSLPSVLPIVFVMILISAGCSNDDQGTAPVVVATGTAPTATPVVVNTRTLTSTTSTPAPIRAPTATPVPIEKPLSSGIRSRNPAPTREPTESFTVHDLDLEPKIGTVFETLLSKLPDNETTRGYTRMGDVAGVLEAFDIDPPLPGSNPSEQARFFEDLATNEYNGFFIPIGEWPAEARDYQGVINTYPDLAFDWTSVAQFARSDNFFLQFQDRATPPQDRAAAPPTAYDVALGSFDPAATWAALSACDCDQPEIREHDGIEYFAWSEGDGIGDIKDRHKRPFYDHIGRGPHLLVRDAEAYYTVRDGMIDELIDVIQGTSPSLADANDYVRAVQWIVSMGVVSEITLRNQGFTVDEVVNSRLELVTRAQVTQDSPLMSPFTMVATGIGYDGKRPFTALVIVHEEATATEANLDVLLTRLHDVTPARSTPDWALPWSYQADQVDIQSSGRFLVARIYFTQSPNTWLMNTPNSLLVHE